MFILMIVKSFFIGILAVCGLGPVCILTVNRTTKYGMTHGFISALGACIGDGLLFSLGLLGILHTIKTSELINGFLHLSGGIFMIVFGIAMLDYKVSTVSEQYEKKSLISYWIKPFVLTMFNPASLIFFITTSMHIIQYQESSIPIKYIFLGSASVSLGSFLTLALLVYLAHIMGSLLKKIYLQKIAYFSGMLLMGAGAYFIVKAIQITFYTGF